MLITQEKMQEIARKNGYEDARDYAMDNDFARCGECRMWGEWGNDIVGDGDSNYCQDHRPDKELVN